jgi:putative SOS response-associated peptidase YedK
MCGRYTLTTVDPNVLGPLFGVGEIPALAPRYNVSPSQDVPVVRVVEKGAPRTLDLCRWGLIPSWSKDPSMGDRMINARAETAAEKPAFRTSFKRHRCLVVADGFYEWKKMSSGRKQPCWIHRKDGLPMAFAGLWARWKSPEGQPLDTFTVLTTDPHPVVADVHDRMPVILQPDAFGAWLDPEEQRADVLQGMIGNAAGAYLEVTPVGTRVNNPHNEGPENVRPAGALALPGF